MTNLDAAVGPTPRRAPSGIPLSTLLVLIVFGWLFIGSGMGLWIWLT